MTTKKTAQLYNIDGDVLDSDDESYSFDYDIEIDDESFAKDKEDKKDKDEVKSEKSDEHEDYNDKGDIESGELVVLEFDEPEDTIMFTVPDLPGALDMSDVPEPDDIEVAEEEKGDVDPWDWKSLGGHAGFLGWLQNMVNSTPKHSGHDVAGLERASAYVQLLLKEISKAMRTDYKGEIDVNHCESMSDGMYKALDALEDRKERVLRFKYPNRYKKKAWVEESGLVKEAQKVTGVNGVTVVVPLLISRLARVIINGTVSAGHSMEDMYDDLKKEYELTKREEAELQQLLHDMGWPMFQDRGMLNEQVDKSRSDNKDWAANYNG